ncbi:3'(2'),5'-bisphosphate nucleotidase CysQ [Dyadobacter sp. CY356]|uniref:3'(2'),5'-bisphosphate nucleotidase CysQ n=1 Tax=Dyadobacter sp. CY356 TaxID=2906442 RepID=UPI001F24BE75|nr:3'(2'),5'-bisphosphate nucleotidase CysQ [Dyadobacter sp. CY356]MCF0058452.1 3'(2'),5'-bisphosphate nucleotidase CysQ [Dyadobacter sp. CY356]
MTPDIDQLLKIARDAGKVVLDIYYDAEKSEEVEFKADDSPLTLADKASNDLIVAKLKSLTPDIPVMSEEEIHVSYDERKNWEYFWCVDPLDGTKEFINRNGEFTINIALVRNRIPVLGVIYIPVSDTIYYATQETGGWKIDSEGNKTALKVDKNSTDWISVGSRSHAAPEETEVLARYPVVKKIAIGSSLKFCLLAEGLAHIYFRQNPTMEWDTAAGQAILTLSGGQMTTLNGEPFLYNKVSLVNGSFICGAQYVTLHKGE